MTSRKVSHRSIGHIHMSQAVEKRQDLVGSRLDIEAQARLNLLGRVSDLALTGSVWRPYDIVRAEFDFAVQSTGYDFRIDGSLADGLLQADVLTAGETLPLRVPVDDELVFSTGFGGVLDFPSLEVGEAVRLESFDPLTLRKSPVRVRAVAEESLEIAAPERTSRRRVSRRSPSWRGSRDGSIARKHRPRESARGPARLSKHQARKAREAQVPQSIPVLSQAHLGPVFGKLSSGGYNDSQQAGAERHDGFPRRSLHGFFLKRAGAATATSVWMDPTLDQPLADATHVKLLNGGVESWTGLLPLIGQLTIEVLEIE